MQDSTLCLKHITKVFLPSKSVYIYILLFFSPTERMREVFNDFYLAITNEEEEEPDTVTDELKTNAAELIKELDTKRG